MIDNQNGDKTLSLPKPYASQGLNTHLSKLPQVNWMKTDTI